MLEKIIKKDKNEALEEILENKKIDEQAKNLLQGILYKVEVSYKDYQKVKGKKQTEDKFVNEFIKNIDKKCTKISIVKPRQKLLDEEIQKELEKSKYYVGEEVVSYPIEEKLLYAIEKKSRYPKILNNKYEEATVGISDLINTGKNLDRVEVLRDFNGWSWNTINKEVENIEANLIYQTLQIILSEKFLENWCQDQDGIIDHLELFMEEMTKKYGETIANEQYELLTQIAIINTIKNNQKYAHEILEKIKRIDEKLENYENNEERIVKIANHKKELLKELNEVEKILGQKTRLKEEFDKRNKELPIEKKLFNIKVIKLEYSQRKKQLLEEIEKDNNLLNPQKYLEEKTNLLKQKEKLKIVDYEKEQLEELVIKFVENFLKCFQTLIKKTSDEEKIINLIYKFRYFMLLPFNLRKKVKDVKELKEMILETEQKLVQKAVNKKIIAEVPFEIMKYVFETRIITLEKLYYKISKKEDKYYVQLFDENVSEEQFEIKLQEKTRTNKKIKIFIW